MGSLEELECQLSSTSKSIGNYKSQKKLNKDNINAA